MEFFLLLSGLIILYGAAEFSFLAWKASELWFGVLYFAMLGLVLMALPILKWMEILPIK